MPVRRIYCPGLDAGATKVELTGQAAIHIQRVLRIRTGEPVTVFNGKGIQCNTRVVSVSGRNVILNILGCETVSRESPLLVTIIQSVCKGERMDWFVQKATELGVSRIIPVSSMRSVVKLDERRIESRHRHWSGIIESACEQCGRNILPELLAVQSSISGALALDESGQRYFLDPESRYRFREQQSPDQSICMVVGPEGGLDQAELDQLQQHQCTGISLGSRTLRSETAGIAALAAIGTLWGDM